MAHFTVYLPDHAEKRVRAMARSEGVTVNKWIAARLMKEVEQSWSAEFLAAAGADPEFPEFRDSIFGADAPREGLD